MDINLQILIIVLTFIWGSIPFGYLLTKIFTGKNILKLGSGNIGSTNVCRIAGKRISICTQLLDMLKGLLPVGAFLYINKEYTNCPDYYVYIIAISSIIGHDYSLFLKFRGGKGVNTTLGASILIAPFPVLVSVLIYFITKWRFKYVSLGSIMLAITLPITSYIIYGLTPTFYYLLICTLLIIIRHKKNIHRLIHNKELQ